MSLTRRLAVALTAAVIGATAGLLLGVRTPAHVEIAGSDTRLWLHFGRTYDEVGVGGLLAARRPTTRTVLGEPLGVRADITLDTSGLVDAQETFNAGILPGYVQVFSDPQQVVEDSRRALFGHLIEFTIAGAGAGLALLASLWWYRRWRAGYERTHLVEVGGPSGLAMAGRRSAEGAFVRRASAVAALVVVIGAVPSTDRHVAPPVALRADPILDGTPLAGTQIEGLLKPAFVAAKDYISTYFNRTTKYYDQLLAALKRRLSEDPTSLPDVPGRTISHFGFVTDRHCNIGMDRVIVGVLRHYKVTTLVSSGDDALSGSFGFESACTRNLADKTAQAGITDVFAGGNHDSPKTIAAQRHQGIKTLQGKSVTVDGLTFLGSPDPRTSRYGQGIVPASAAAQALLVGKQGADLGRTACAAAGPVIAVAHDPRAGEAALQTGCGHVTLALDGHTHTQAGPAPVAVDDTSTGYQFTGGSAGGAPNGVSVNGALLSHLTVGPLNHDASMSIVSVDADTGALIGITTLTFDPGQEITVTQQITPQ